MITDKNIPRSCGNLIQFECVGPRPEVVQVSRRPRTKPLVAAAAFIKLLPFPTFSQDLTSEGYNKGLLFHLLIKKLCVHCIKKSTFFFKLKVLLFLLYLQW
jgi:hypothetical protein